MGAMGVSVDARNAEAVVIEDDAPDVEAVDVEVTDAVVAEAVIAEAETPEPGRSAEGAANVDVGAEPLPAPSTDTAPDTAEAPGLRNKRPAGKLRQRLRR